MKIITLIIILTFIVHSLYPQKVISGKSKPTKINLYSEFSRGLPPNLFVDLSFEDENNNGILEANESANLILNIKNKGKGKAQGLLVKIKDNVLDKEFHIEGNKQINFIEPEESIEILIHIKAGFKIKTAEHKLEILVTEFYGFDMDPAYLILNTLEFQEPELVFSGLDIIDIGPGTGAVNEDGQLQPGEQVKVKIVIQNIGQNVAKETKYKVKSTDDNIWLQEAEGVLGNLGIGEVKDFWITVSPNKRVSYKNNLPLFLTLTNGYKSGELKNFQLPLVLNQKPPVADTVYVEPDIEKYVKARFEVPDKITANIGNVIDIRQVPPSKTQRIDAIAVVIGIEDYDYFAPAPYAANDATIMKDYFKNVLGVRKVYTYTNEEVSGFFFDNTFNPEYGELQKGIMKGQTELFVYYSGHGMPSKDGTKVYLFPKDGKITIQGYDLNKFYKDIDDLGAKSVTIFIDACFSGFTRTSETYETENLLAMKGVAIKPDVLHPWESNPNFTVFTSSGFNETSLGFDPSETGLFTYYLCAGLQGEADSNGDKKITVGELSTYVIDKVKDISEKIRGLQTPQFYGDPSCVIAEY